METAISPKDRILQWAEKHGVTMTAQFVPWSQSRNKGDRFCGPSKEKRPSLNWRATLHRNGREIVTTDYSKGYGHCQFKPKPLRSGGMLVIEHDELMRECETGKHKHKSTPLDIDEVLWSLSMDYSVIGAGGFEQWAADLGYDADSRKAEAIYRACLDIALKLRSALGDSAMMELQELAQDY